MRKMKKNALHWISVLLLLSMVMSVLASCSLFSDEPDDEDPKNGDSGGSQIQEPDEPHHVVVLFDPNNGESTLRASVAENETLQKPEDPVREGYVFLGWFEEGAEEPFDFQSVLTGCGDFTLTARWARRTVAWDTILPKNISALITLSDFCFRVDAGMPETDPDPQGEPPEGEPQSPPQLFMLCIPESAKLLVGLDDQRNIFGVLDGEWFVVDSDGERVTTVCRSYAEQNILYIEVSEDGKSTLVRVDLLSAIAAGILSRFEADDLSESVEGALALVASVFAGDLPGVPELPETQLNTVTLSAIGPLLALFFEIAEEEDVTVYTLDYARMHSLNNDLGTLAFAECLDRYFGELTFDTIKLLVRKAMILKVSEALDLAARLGIGEEELVAALQPLLARFLPQADFSAVLADPELRAATLLSLLAGEKEREIKNNVEGFLGACETMTVYELIGILLANSADREGEPEDEPITEPDAPDLQEIIDAFINATQACFAFSFNVREGRIVSLTVALDETTLPVFGLTIRCGFLLTVEADKPYAPAWSAEVMENVGGAMLDDLQDFAVAPETGEDGYREALTFSAEDPLSLVYELEYLYSHTMHEIDGEGIEQICTETNCFRTEVETDRASVFAVAVSPAKKGYYRVELTGFMQTRENRFLMRTYEGDDAVYYRAAAEYDGEFTTEMPEPFVCFEIRSLVFYCLPETGAVLGRETYREQIGQYEEINFADALDFLPEPRIEGNMRFERSLTFVRDEEDRIVQVAFFSATESADEQVYVEYIDENTQRSYTQTYCTRETVVLDVASTEVDAIPAGGVYWVRLEGAGTATALSYMAIVYEDEPETVCYYDFETGLISAEMPEATQEEGTMHLDFFYCVSTSEATLR